MTRIRLDREFVKNAICPPDKPQVFHWDSEAVGLALRVTAAGSKAYIFQAKLGRRAIRVTIGDPSNWPPEVARKEARRLKTLTDQNIDPRQEAADQLAKTEAAQAEVKTKETKVQDAWDAYLAYQQEKMGLAHIERGKKWGARHLADHLNLAKAGGVKRLRGRGKTRPGVLYPLLQLPIGELTAEKLRAWQRKEAATRPNNARQGYELFRAFWRWAATRPEYATAINVQAVEEKELRDEVPGRKSAKFDVLGREHLMAWFAAIRSMSNPIAAAYLQTLMLTGARREEIARLRWEDVDFSWNAIWVNDKVVAEGRKIPLTPYVRALLLSLPRRNEWVFSSPAAKSGRIQEPRYPHNRALAVAGLPPLTLHGLRRSFIANAEWVEMPAGVVAQIVGHKPSATAERHYKPRPLDLLALWHRKYEKWLLDQAAIEQPGEYAIGGLRVVGGEP